MLFVVVQFLARVLIVVINILIGVAQYNDFINATAVAKGWVIVRDLCNMFFIIVLLVIAFGTILKIETYRYNRLLGKLILYAFLINFSKFIAGFWIDIGQVIMMTFVNGFKDAAAGNLATGLGMNEMLTLMKGNVDIDSSSLMNAILLAIALLVIAVIVVIIMTIILLLRILMLWILIVLAPIAFITRIFPNTAKYSDQWWGEFNKQIIVGPVMAFFLWLALTVIALNGADSTNYGFRQVRTEEQAALVENLEGGGSDTARSIAASITTISQNDRLLSYMITIGMLLVALTAAQQLGVAGSKIAGDWSQKIRTGGLTAAGVLSGVAAARLAMRGARGGAKMVGGSVRRWAYQNIRPAKFASKSYWEGVGARGKELEAKTKERLVGKGRQQMESWQYKWLRGRPNAVQSINENVIESQQNAAAAEFKKKLGPNPGLEKYVHETLVAREQAKAGGYDELNDMGGVLKIAYGAGHGDDYYQELIAQGKIHQGNFKEFGFQNWEEVTGQGKYGGAEYFRARALMADSMKINREKFDPFVIGRKIAKEQGREDKYLQAMLDGTIVGEEREQLEASVADIIQASRTERNQAVQSASEEERMALKSMYGASEAARVIGHDEQTTTNYNPETGQAYMMDLLEQRDKVMGERSKLTGQELAQVTLPHAQVQYTYAVHQEDDKEKGIRKGDIVRDQFGNPVMYADWDPRKMTPQGRAEQDQVATIQGRDISRLGPRMPERLMMAEGGSAVPDEFALLDKWGGFAEGTLVDAEGEKKSKKDLAKIRIEQNREAYRKMYAAKYGRAGDHILLPDELEQGFEKEYKKRRLASPEQRAVVAEHAAAEQARAEANIPEEAVVPMTDREKAMSGEAEAMMAKARTWADDLPKTVDELGKAVDEVQGHFRDVSKGLRDLEDRLTNPEAKKAVSQQYNAVSDQMRLAADRSGFFSAGAEFQRHYFQRSSQLLEDIAKSIKLVTKPVEPSPKTEGAEGEAAEGTKPKPEPPAGETK